MERRRSFSARLNYEPFPRKERNYILMELSSPPKEGSRRASPENDPISEKTSEEEAKNSSNMDTMNKSEEDSKNGKTIEMENKEKDEIMKTEIQSDFVEDEEKVFQDTKERTDSSDCEWKRSDEPSWEELGLVDDDVVKDFHNTVSIFFSIVLLIFNLKFFLSLSSTHF